MLEVSPRLGVLFEMVVKAFACTDCVLVEWYLGQFTNYLLLIKPRLALAGELQRMLLWRIYAASAAAIQMLSGPSPPAPCVQDKNALPPS